MGWGPKKLRIIARACYSLPSEPAGVDREARLTSVEIQSSNESRPSLGNSSCVVLQCLVLLGDILLGRPSCAHQHLSHSIERTIANLTSCFLLIPMVLYVCVAVSSSTVPNAPRVHCPFQHESASP